MKNLIRAFTQRISWSALGKLGDRRIVKATAAFPLFGYLLFFGPVGDRIFLMFSAGSSSEFPDFIKEYAPAVFFCGLTIFSIGAFLYQLLVPGEIKRHPVDSDFLAYIKALDSSAVTRLYAERPLRAYSNAFPRRVTSVLAPNDYRQLPYCYPHELAKRIEITVYEAFSIYLHHIESQFEKEYLEHAEGRQQVVCAAMVERLPLDFSAGRDDTPSPLFWKGVWRNISSRFGNELLLASHQFIDLSKTSRRVVVFAIFSLGTAIMALPAMYLLFYYSFLMARWLVGD